MNIYKKYMSDEEYKDYIETRELMAEMDQNERLAEAEEKGIAKGLAKGETNAKIEAVINLIKELNLSLDQAMTILKVDISYKSRIETRLKELGIKYNK